MSLFSEHEHSAFCEICSPPPPEPLERRMPAKGLDTIEPPVIWEAAPSAHFKGKLLEIAARVARESAEYRAGEHRRGRWVFLRNDSQYRQEPV